MSPLQPRKEYFAPKLASWGVHCYPLNLKQNAHPVSLFFPAQRCKKAYLSPPLFKCSIDSKHIKQHCASVLQPTCTSQKVSELVDIISQVLQFVKTLILQAGLAIYRSTWQPKSQKGQGYPFLDVQVSFKLYFAHHIDTQPHPDGSLPGCSHTHLSLHEDHFVVMIEVERSSLNSVCGPRQVMIDHLQGVLARIRRVEYLGHLGESFNGNHRVLEWKKSSIFHSLYSYSLTNHIKVKQTQGALHLCTLIIIFNRREVHILLRFRSSQS